jgi:hypothetical protein
MKFYQYIFLLHFIIYHKISKCPIIYVRRDSHILTLLLLASLQLLEIVLSQWLFGISERIISNYMIILDSFSELQ